MTNPARALGAVVLAIATLLVGVTAADAATRIKQITVDGSINPASAAFIMEAIALAEAEEAAALLIELDTPGGLVSATQDIIKAMLNARVPTIVYVTPRGAWAASAGTMITIAANVAAMTPGSTIGAAHPVPALPGGGGAPPGEDEDSKPAADPAMEKAANLIASYVESIAKHRKRNVEWAAEAVKNSVAVDAEEALELNVIDFVASNRGDLLAMIDGFETEVDGETVVLETKDAVIEPVEMTLLQQIFNFLADPGVVTVLFLGGLLGLYIEFNNPGLIVPGAAGAVCLVLTGIALQILPFDWVGVLLILAGIGLLFAELFFTSYGILFAAGLGLFLLGGTMMFDMPEVSDLNVDFWSVLFPTVVGFGGFAAIVVYAVGRSMAAQQTAGVDEMVGLVGRSSTPIDPQGKVFIRGEYWNVRADETIGEGEAVEVVRVDGLELYVRRASSPR